MFWAVSRTTTSAIFQPTERSRSWDTPQHVITDDAEDTGASEIWPGKDYSNARVLDFHTLSKPDEDMYDRTKVPRMPWHDVGMQVVGQPARDLARHFVQRQVIQ